MKCDFSGYATKHNVKCSDGLTIKHGAFKAQDGMKVPLVWQHLHDDPENVLGHAYLEARDDGMYAYCSFNETPRAQTTREQVRHGDITSMSIFANKIQKRGDDVVHGVIREVSLVLSGANPGATIDFLSFQHSDDGPVEVSDEEAFIYMDQPILHDDMDEDTESVDVDDIAHADDDETINDIFETMDDKQQKVTLFMIGQGIKDFADAAIKAGADPKLITQAMSDMTQVKQSEDYDDEDEDPVAHTEQDNTETLSHSQEENKMSYNVIEGVSESGETIKHTLTKSEIDTIFHDAMELGSLKKSVIQHAQTYGIENIDILFPDAVELNNSPEFISRQMDWVTAVLSATNHSPFSRIKTSQADITADEARARGYIKGNLKREEVIKLLGRITTPTTIYKKQKLDRDDIIDITGFDVVVWLKGEMRLMLNEEIARAILVGDGRDVSSPDKINEDNIRPIWKENELYARHITIAADATPSAIVETVLRSRRDYRGSGSPKFYAGVDVLSDLLLDRDKMDRRQYATETELSSGMRVSGVIEIPIFDGLTRTNDAGETVKLLGIIVNLKDYTVGTTRGGEVSMFDDFDLNYNQFLYLIETRMSGALTKVASALVIEQLVSSTTTVTEPAA